jgi:hypothetical protein
MLAVIILSKGSKAVALKINNKIESHSPDFLILYDILENIWLYKTRIKFNINTIQII